MKRFLMAAAIAAGLGCALVAVTADEPKKADQGKKADTGTEEQLEASKLSTAPKCCAQARTVNFNKELNVPLDYLGTIGVQIAEARKGPDPVALALAARSLEVAEGVAGKKASVTAADVMKEAVELALLRAVPVELKAMKAVVSDASTKDAVGKALEAAEKADADAKAAAKSGERTRSIHGTLEVRNNTEECMRIYVDGKYVGTVHAGMAGTFHVHAHAHRNTLQAFCEEGGELLATSCVHGRTNYHIWTINP